MKIKAIKKFFLLSLVAALLTGCTHPTTNPDDKEILDGAENNPAVLTVSEAGEYSGDYDEIVVMAADVVVKDATTKTLTITKEVGDGDVTLDGVTVSDVLTINGGGENSIHLTRSTVNRIDSNREEATVRVVAGEGTVFEHGFYAENTIIVVEPGVVIPSLTLGANTSVIVKEGGKIETLSVTDTATGADISIEGDVTTLRVEANVTITGDGRIETLDTASEVLVNSEIEAENVLTPADEETEVKAEDEVVKVEEDKENTSDEKKNADKNPQAPGQHKPKPHKHVYDLVDFKAPDYSSDGYEVYQCSCGDGWTNWLPKLVENPTPTPTPDVPEITPTPEPEEHEHKYVLVNTVEAIVGKAGEKTYECECGDGYTEVIPALELKVTYEETSEGLVFTANSAEFVASIYEVILTQEVFGSADKYDVAASGIVFDGVKFTIPAEIVSEILNGDYVAKIVSNQAYELKVTVTTGALNRAEVVLSQNEAGDIVVSSSADAIQKIKSVNVSGNMVYVTYTAAELAVSDTEVRIPYERVLEKKMMPNTTYTVQVEFESDYEAVRGIVELHKGYEKTLNVSSSYWDGENFIVTFADLQSLNDAQSVFVSAGNNSASGAAYMYGEKNEDSLTYTIYGSELEAFLGLEVTIGLGFYGSNSMAWSTTATLTVEEQIPGGEEIPGGEQIPEGSGDEIIEEEIIEDEIIGDEVIGDEIIEDEVIEDKMISDEIIEEEIIEEEVIEDEVVLEEEIVEETEESETEIAEESVVEAEVEKETVVEETTEETVILEEVKVEVVEETVAEEVSETEEVTEEN